MLYFLTSPNSDSALYVKTFSLKCCIHPVDAWILQSWQIIFKLL